MNFSAPALNDYETCAAAIHRICQPWQLDASRWREFRGSVRNFTAAALNVTELRLGHSRMCRHPEAAVGQAPRYYSLLFQAHGAARLLHARGSAVVGTGGLVLLHSDSPIIVEVSAGTRQYALNFFEPKHVERIDRAGIDNFRCMTGESGPSSLLIDALSSVLRNADNLGALDLRGHVVELLLASLGCAKSPASSAVRSAAPDFHEVVRYIDTQLHDFTLSPARIAVEFKISLRQLYRLAAAAQRTPAALIWERRLMRARQLLGSQSAHPIIRTAYDCGFRDSGHFSRSYRRAYGEAPSETRSRINQ